MDELREVASGNADAQIRIAVLDFSTSVYWHTPNGPVDVEDFIWEDLDAGGLTNVSAALDELDSKLHQDAFLSSDTGSYLPVIIFMTDGYATDPNHFPEALQNIRKNRWYTHATKIGFALGENPDLNMIAEIVGNHEAVIRTTDLARFAELIVFASRTASMAASTSRTPDDWVNGAAVVGDLPLYPEEHIENPGNYTPEDPVNWDDPLWGWTPESGGADNQSWAL